MEVTDFDPRDVRIRRYNVPDPEPRGLGGNRGLREMLLKTMLALPMQEIERRAEEAAEQRKFQFARDERAADQSFSKEMAGTAHTNSMAERQADRDFDKPYRDAELELKRQELKTRGNPMASKIGEAALGAAIDSGDVGEISRLAPGADPAQVKALASKAGLEASNELADPETQARLEQRMRGMADAEVGDQPSAAQNWRRAHEKADDLLGGFSAADSGTKNAIREALKKAFMERLRVRFPGAAEEFEAPRGQSTSMFGDLYNWSVLAS